MNPNYNQTITVYNRIKGADTEDGKDIWKRTILENCFYKLSQTKIDDERQQKWQAHTLPGYQNHRIIFPTENLPKQKVLVTASL